MAVSRSLKEVTAKSPNWVSRMQRGGPGMVPERLAAGTAQVAARFAAQGTPLQGEPRVMLKPIIAMVGAGVLAAACTSTGNVERNAAGGAVLGGLAGAAIGAVSGDVGVGTGAAVGAAV